MRRSYFRPSWFVCQSETTLAKDTQVFTWNVQDMSDMIQVRIGNVWGCSGCRLFFNLFCGKGMFFCYQHYRKTYQPILWNNQYGLETIHGTIGKIVCISVCRGRGWCPFLLSWFDCFTVLKIGAVEVGAEGVILFMYTLTCLWECIDMLHMWSFASILWLGYNIVIPQLVRIVWLGKSGWHPGTYHLKLFKFHKPLFYGRNSKVIRVTWWW